LENYFSIDGNNHLAFSLTGAEIGYELHVRGSIPVRGRDFSRHRLQTVSGAHPASNEMGNLSSFLGGKETGA